jgi:hypothetical protein
MDVGAISQMDDILNASLEPCEKGQIPSAWAQFMRGGGEISETVVEKNGAPVHQIGYHHLALLACWNCIPVLVHKPDVCEIIVQMVARPLAT